MTRGSVNRESGVGTARRPDGRGASSVLVPVTVVCGVAVPVVEVVDVVAVGHRLVTAARTVLVVAVLPVRRVDWLALVPMAVVLVMGVAVMEIVHLVAVLHRRVSARWSVHVGVIGMGITAAHSILLANPPDASAVPFSSTSRSRGRRRPPSVPTSVGLTPGPRGRATSKPTGAGRRNLDAVPGIVIFTRLRAAPGHVEQVMAALEALHEGASDEPGTLAFAVHVAADEPNLLLCYEVYADDDALAAHRGSDAVRDAVRSFGELLDGAPEVTYAHLVRGKGVPSG